MEEKQNFAFALAFAPPWVRMLSPITGFDRLQTALRIVMSPVTTVRSEATNSNGALPPRNPDPSPPQPSWSNVHKEVRKTPDPHCEICTGSGRIDCHFCQGKGRTNSVDMQMLPKGKWPRWCKTCRGSGLSYCSRCLGTGEYRYIMGFQFMKMDSIHTGDNSNAVQSTQNRRTAKGLYE